MKFWAIRGASILVAVLFCVALMSVGPYGDKHGYLLIGSRLITLAGLYVTLSVSLNLINGITGQFSIGHAAFFQIGAYTAAILSRAYYPATHGLNPTVWVFLMSMAGGIMAALAGILVGIPSLRLRGDYLAIVTLGFGEIIRIFITTQQSIGGAYGLNVKPQNVSILLSWLLAIVCIAACRNLLRSSHGLPFLAIREDEVASNAMGVNTTRYKVVAFAIGSAFAGMAGAIFAHSEAFIQPQSFAMDLSFMILTMVVLGGTGSITGSTFAALVLFYLPEILRGDQQVPSFAFSAFVILVFGMTATALRTRDRHFETSAAKWTATAIGWGLSVIAALVVLFLIKQIPGVGNATYDANRLRMVVFAITLIVMMLLRPQGIFGRGEISIERLFEPRKRSVA